MKNYSFLQKKAIYFFVCIALMASSCDKNELEPLAMQQKIDQTDTYGDDYYTRIKGYLSDCQEQPIANSHFAYQGHVIPNKQDGSFLSGNILSSFHEGTFTTKVYHHQEVVLGLSKPVTFPAARDTLHMDKTTICLSGIQGQIVNCRGEGEQSYIQISDGFQDLILPTSGDGTFQIDLQADQTYTLTPYNKQLSPAASFTAASSSEGSTSDLGSIPACSTQDLKANTAMINYDDSCMYKSALAIQASLSGASFSLSKNKTHLKITALDNEQKAVEVALSFQGKGIGLFEIEEMQLKTPCNVQSSLHPYEGDMFIHVSRYDLDGGVIEGNILATFHHDQSSGKYYYPVISKSTLAGNFSVIREDK